MSATQAVAWARAQARAGVHEQGGSNQGPQVSDWIRNGGGTPGWAWCQYFVDEACVHGGAPRVKDGYTPNFLGGHYASRGFIRIARDAARPGDLVYYKWPGVSHDICDHVGMLVTKHPDGSVTDVEGNTSVGNSGSQNNGDGVYVRRRPSSVIAGFVRVPYAPLKPGEWPGVVLGRGSSGSLVRQVQRWLNAVGAKGDQIAVDGHFGTATEKRVRQFQDNRNRAGAFAPAHSLKVDGKVGPHTWRALYEARK